MNTIYIGSFPPPYGGVTVKNNNLYKALCSSIKIGKVNLSTIKKHPFRLIGLLFTLCNKNNKFVIGVAGKRTRKRFSKLLYYINRSSMNKSILIIMGGTASTDIVNDEGYKKYVQEYKQVFVETIGMKNTLLSAGLINADIYPNGRFKPQSNHKIEREKIIKCVFFSNICEMKGCNEILQTAARLPSVSFTFYGHIDESYKATFESYCNSMENVDYKGVFTGDDEEKYDELSKYNILLFPTKYTIEGVPGILVEAKISGLAIVASGNSYNKELVSDGENGIILKENNTNSIEDAIRFYLENEDILYEHRVSSKLSADNYYIENYINSIISFL